jgi:iron complex transport system ATP-binding protein
MGIPVVGEIPFTLISQEAFTSNLDMLTKADAVILTDFPVGYGNIKNIQAAETALDRGIPVVVVESTPISKRDFTNGHLQEYFNKLKGKGAITVNRDPDALQQVMKLRELRRGMKGGV